MVEESCRNVLKGTNQSAKRAFRLRSRVHLSGTTSPKRSNKGKSMPEEHRLKQTNGEHPLSTSQVHDPLWRIVAVNELDMHVREGEIYGLIGPNGAGKTTIFNLLTGVYEPTSATFTFKANESMGLHPYQISRRGISRTFQNIRLFPSMSVLENVMTACHIDMRNRI